MCEVRAGKCWYKSSQIISYFSRVVVNIYGIFYFIDNACKCVWTKGFDVKLQQFQATFFLRLTRRFFLDYLCP